jgi:hypothetical protein
MIDFLVTVDWCFVVVDRSNYKDYDLQLFKLAFTNAGLYTNIRFCYKLSLAE